MTVAVPFARSGGHFSAYTAERPVGLLASAKDLCLVDSRRLLTAFAASLGSRDRSGNVSGSELPRRMPWLVRLWRLQIGRKPQLRVLPFLRQAHGDEGVAGLSLAARLLVFV